MLARCSAVGKNTESESSDEKAKQRKNTRRDVITRVSLQSVFVSYSAVEIRA